MTAEEFKQWEDKTFGYGYGTGEGPVIEVIKIFFDTFGDKTTYDYEDYEVLIGRQATWLLINALIKGGVIDYGTSPRYGFLSSFGKDLKTFFAEHTEDELHEILMKDDGG